MTDIKQFDMWGNEVTPPDPPASGGRKFVTMQEKFGTIEGKTCKDCKHLVCYVNWDKKRWYKCELWRISSSAATDIRLKNTACGKWEEEE